MWFICLPGGQTKNAESPKALRVWHGNPAPNRARSGSQYGERVSGQGGQQLGGAQQSVGMAVVAMSMVDEMELLHENRLTHREPSFPKK